MELQHLSYSSISSYQLCPKAWEFHYIKKVKTPTAPALVFGSAFHNTIEELLRANVAGENRDTIQTWNHEWVKACQQEIAWGEESQEELFNTGLKLLTCPDTQNLLTWLRPALNADGSPKIETYIELRVPGVPIPVIGYIDLITQDGVLADFKTSARSWNSDKAQQETQPLFYMAALSQAGYTANPQYRFRHHVFLKTKKPQVQTIESQHSIGRIFWLLQMVREVWGGINTGVFPPNNTSWKCSSRWCDYYSTCRG